MFGMTGDPDFIGNIKMGSRRTPSTVMIGSGRLCNDSYYLAKPMSTNSQWKSTDSQIDDNYILLGSLWIFSCIRVL